MVNEMRVGWLQKRKKLLLLKHNLRMDDIRGEKINGMVSVANDVTGFDAFWSIIRKYGAVVNKRLDVRVKR